MASSAVLRRMVLLVFLSLLVASSVVSARRIDCTRFVFAPRCRGVAAKRASESLSSDESTDLDDDTPFTDSLLPSDASRQEHSATLWRLLVDLSRAVNRPVISKSRGKTVLDQLLRS